MYPSTPRAIAVGAGSVIILLLVLLSANSASIIPLDLTSERAVHDGILQSASNETLGFQKIFVISLASRTDHRDSMSLASALTDLQIEYVDGVTEIDEKALPPHLNKFKMGKGALNSWRAHMNVLRLIVEQNLTSALVFEDDVDWDLRIKTQMRDFGKASQLLLQPGQHEREHEFSISETPRVMSSTSPYGDIDRWDLLWLGHCGSHIPHASDDQGKSQIPLARTVIRDDPTVAEPQHLEFEYGGDSLKQDYEPHTRVISYARRNVCTLAYGITQQGARRFLHELAVKKLSSSADLMFQQTCDGLDGRDVHTCLSVQPPLFEHHRPVSAKASFSDIGDHGNGYNKEAYTYNIRWSTKVNFPKLLAGQTDYIDQFRDGEPRKDFESNE